MTGTSCSVIKKVQHTYVTAGSYVISVKAESGEFAFYSDTINYTHLLGKYESTDNYYNYSYGGCVTAIELGNGARIGKYAFNRLFNMVYITIPNTTTYISIYAFSNCYALKSVTIPDTMTSITTNVFRSCYALKSVIIPNTITIIDTYAFSSCYALESIVIPNSITRISDNAFKYCYTLKFVTISNTITSINNSTFSTCYTLRSITIPNTVTNIDIYAFDSCYNMDEYHFLSTMPPTLAGTSVFQKIQSNCKMYVPYSEDHSILEAYKTATN